MNTQSDPSIVHLFDVPVRAESLEQAVARIDRIVEARRPTIHVVLNASKISKVAADDDFLAMMRDFDLVHADGASVVLAGRLLGRPLPERVAGIDLMAELVRLAARRGYRPFLLGARPEVVSACAETLCREHPGLEIAGVHDGYWDPTDDEEEARVVRTVRESCADMLFIAMPTPRKERFLHRHRLDLGVPFAMGVGGAFDVVTGVVNRAPVAWQKAGMEWAYRLLQEPRKMWKRYLVTNSHFAWLLGKALVQERLLGRETASTAVETQASRRVIETEIVVELPAAPMRDAADDTAAGNAVVADARERSTAPRPRA